MAKWWCVLLRLCPLLVSERWKLRNSIRMYQGGGSWAKIIFFNCKQFSCIMSMKNEREEKFIVNESIQHYSRNTYSNTSKGVVARSLAAVCEGGFVENFPGLTWTWKFSSFFSFSHFLPSIHTATVGGELKVQVRSNRAIRHWIYCVR